jgi:hypothetical protein
MGLLSKGWLQPCSQRLDRVETIVSDKRASLLRYSIEGFIEPATGVNLVQKKVLGASLMSRQNKLECLSIIFLAKSNTYGQRYGQTLPDRTIPGLNFQL